MQSGTEHPVNPLPPVVVLLFLAIAGVEAVLSLGAYGLVGGPQAVGWRLLAAQDYGFSSEAFGWMLRTGQWPAEHALRFLTYGFVHVAVTHALFVGVMLLALGKFVGEVLPQWAILALFFAGQILGAVVYGLTVTSNPWLLGGYPGVYALIGAFTCLLWVRLVATGSNGARAFTLIGFLLAIRLVFALLFGGDPTWVADLSGFVAGFALTVVLAPGGWSRVLARLRRG